VPHKSYSDYYKDNTAYRRMGPSQSAASYTYDRVFYQSSAVSPYLNLVRPGTTYGKTRYQTWVKPEQQRREAQSQPSAGRVTRPLHAPVGSPSPYTPRKTTTSYYKNTYSGYQRAAGH